MNNSRIAALKWWRDGGSNNPYVQAWLDEADANLYTKPSNSVIASMNTFMDAISSEISNLEYLHLLFYNDTNVNEAFTLNLIDPSKAQLTLVNSPTVYINGVGTNGTTSYLNTNLNADEFTVLSNTSGSLGVYGIVHGLNNTASVKWTVGNNRIGIWDVNTLPVVGRLSDVGSNNFSETLQASNSLYHVYTEGTINYYEKNGVPVTNNVSSKVALTNQPLFYLCNNNGAGVPEAFSESGVRLSCVYLGNKDVDSLVMYNALIQYKSDIGL